ncbi:MAG: triphosphoribosyl-dephospho-CoA synthase [Planctomycetes bacterium]|nr:triphosphoribosyl-dephospho-CoA synthase [Planctomycetota bacterium]
MSDPRSENGADPLTVGQCASLACLLEAAAPKPGNVHRGADFDDVTFYDFAASAVAIAPAMDRAMDGVGAAVLSAVRATRAIVRTNTNLGMVLLLAPLAAVPRETPLREGVGAVLASLSPQDARDVYEAIRLAAPGGLGKAKEMDVAGPPPDDLLAAMRTAADRDMIARQYTHDFEDVLEFVAPAITEGQSRGWTLIDSIIHAHLRTMHAFPDSLIARKCGEAAARQAAARAGAILEAGEPGDEAYLRAVADFDVWLRSDGHRRNPGTTADLIAAGLFVGFREGALERLPLLRSKRRRLRDSAGR